MLAVVLGLGVDESYAVAVARRLSLSYFDHPPLAFWMAGAAARLFHTEGRLVVRLPFILLFAATTWLLFRFSSRLFGERAGAYAALAFNLSPVFAVSHGSWVLPDGPLLFCTLAALACLARVLFPGHDTPRHPTLWWLGAGAMTGLALLSKYHAAFLPLGTFLFLLTTRDRRHWLRRAAPYLGLVLAIALFLPVIMWNAEHDWVSFRFQGARAAWHGGVHVAALLLTIGGQAVYLLPWIWLPLVVGLVGGLRMGPRAPEHWFLCCSALGPILVFGLAALGGRPSLPHWAAPGYVTLFPLLGATLASRLARGDRWSPRWIGFAIAAFSGVVGALAAQASTGALTRLVPGLLRWGDPTLEALDWRELRNTLQTRGALGRADLVVAATDWIDAGKVAYALGPEVPVLCFSTTPHHFAYLYDQRQFLGHDVVLVVRGFVGEAAVAPYTPYFQRIEWWDSVAIRRGGRLGVALTLFRARDFRAAPP